MKHLVAMAFLLALLADRGWAMETKYPVSMPEEELKNKVAAEWFSGFDCTQILGKVDFCVAVPATDLNLYDAESVLWAEAKKGAKQDIYESFVQLILTIGKESTHEKHLPPKFLGAFDAREIAFLPYDEVFDVFTQNDFNWKVAPSNHGTREFKELYARAKSVIERGVYRFDFLKDAVELAKFVKANFRLGTDKVEGIRITKNNFTHIYGKWREIVMPTIEIPDWKVAKQNGILDADFFLADILSSRDLSLTNRLNILLKNDHYRQVSGKNALGFDLFTEIGFKDRQTAHRQFWKHYRRPPKKEYWDFIVNRRDLLVPQDVRERKGSFFTPRRWVELSQEYLRLELGDDWQEKYYVWDCCAGTGNLLAGLTNKYHVWASTLDRQDVDAMRQRIRLMNEASRSGDGANLLDEHVFQFDFLNDSFEKLPPKLRAIIESPEERRRLVVYINPPYAEAGNARQRAGTGDNKTNVSVSHRTYARYLEQIGIAGRELFAQFFMRVYTEIPGCVLGEFSTLKHLQAPNFRMFRQTFKGRLGRCFVVPADTFDNVKGDFPIGFFIWHLDGSNVFRECECDVYSAKGLHLRTKTLLSYDDERSINDWLIETRTKGGMPIAFLSARSHDVQHVLDVYFRNDKSKIKSPRGTWMTSENLIESAIYVAVCHSIGRNWLNDRDQFLFPNDGWQKDEEFQNDSLAFALFAPANNVKASDGVNHWIPFTEREVGAQECFQSHFMSDYIAGKMLAKTGLEQGDLFAGTLRPGTRPIVFSTEAQAVMDAGRTLWKYYHAQKGANPDASFYDIRLRFQGQREKNGGRMQMNTGSDDPTYMKLLSELRERYRLLARKIASKAYEYGFLKR